jgi:hypothetical protein
VAPALGVALILTSLSHVFWPQPSRFKSWWRQVIATSLVGVSVLTLGLLWEERDGRVSTYSAMLISQTCMLWWQLLRNPRH